VTSPPSPVSWSAGEPNHEVTMMVKRLLMVIVLAFAGLLSACTSPSGGGGASPPAVESPGESPAETTEASPSGS
jgi:hypothetical protein